MAEGHQAAHSRWRVGVGLIVADATSTTAEQTASYMNELQAKLRERFRAIPPEQAEAVVAAAQNYLQRLSDGADEQDAAVMSREISEVTRQRVWQLLTDAIEWLEGDHAGIPECCVAVFMNGRRADAFFADKPDRRSFHHVPCDECWAAGRAIPLRSGHSEFSVRLLGIRSEIMCVAKNSKHEGGKEKP
jgi:hypothetical protein